MTKNLKMEIRLSKHNWDATAEQLSWQYASAILRSNLSKDRCFHSITQVGYNVDVQTLTASRLLGESGSGEVTKNQASLASLYFWVSH